ncbi:MAG TPA: alanine--glyoxylate aminotransferase family protein [Terriglobia bacterium]|nr:alanine--glyoxylate aminotransferase family protein [Terriglobia bacterium]
MIKERLFTPGPTQLLPQVQVAMSQPILHHRTDEFRAIVKEVLEDLKYLYNTTNDVLLFASSGTGAMEGAVVNLLSPGDKVIVVSAGKFGERWIGLCKAYGVNAQVVSLPYGAAVDPRQVADLLEQQPDTRAVFVQYTESSTGVRHDVKALAEIVHPLADTVLVVDAITGLGVMEMPVDEWHLDVVVGGSQKALMIPPGLAFASVSAKAWKMMENSKSPKYYFDFQKERKNLAKGETAYTPAITLVVALREALKFIRQIGRDRLICNAGLLARATRAAVQTLGLKLFAEASPSDALTAVCAPEGLDSGAIIKEFKKNFGVIVANGQGEMKGKIFRIAHLGYYDFPDTVAIVACLEIVLEKLGLPIELGSGVKAAQQTYLHR